MESDEVEVRNSQQDNEHQAIIVDAKRERAWSGTGTTAGEASTKALHKFLKDRRSREYVDNK